MNDKIDVLKKCENFKNYISLGHCCHVATELKNLGFRDASLPFDWLRTGWGAIELAFDSKFKDFLKYDDLRQSKMHPHAYRNDIYNAVFVHDFVDYKPLKKQIENVQQKYQRRIDCFFKKISEPSLFIRYVMDYDELVYISENYDRIEKMLKRYNINNEIVFISHDQPKNIDVSRVKFIFFIDLGDYVDSSKTPLTSSKELFDYLSNVTYDKRNENLAFISEIEKNKIKKPTLFERIKRKYIKHIASKRKYTHSKQY